MQQPLVEDGLQRDAVLDGERGQELYHLVHVQVYHPSEDYTQVLYGGGHSALEDLQRNGLEHVVIPLNELRK